MKPGKRFGLSAEQKLDVWRRWKAGQTLHEIDPPKARGSGGSCHSGSLGGRSPARLREQSHRDLGGTPFALCHADQGTQPKYSGGCGALSKHVRKLPATLRRSLTWDRGLEMAKHKDFTVATDVKVYFCDPQSPWQRGSNENTNGLLRQYFPKNTDLTDYSQSDLNKVAQRLNQRPRQTLGFHTPASKLQESVASTH